MIQQVFPKRTNKTVNYEADENGRMHMNEPFPEVPRHLSMISVLTFKKVEMEDFDENESRFSMNLLGMDGYQRSRI